jgi:hypothetical protein
MVMRRQYSTGRVGWLKRSKNTIQNGLYLVAAIGFFGLIGWAQAAQIHSIWLQLTMTSAEIDAIERSAYYSGCTAARAAGVAPIYRASPGYRVEMDGDGDGIACEPDRGGQPWKTSLIRRTPLRD